MAMNEATSRRHVYLKARIPSPKKIRIPLYSHNTQILLRDDEL